MNRPLLIVVSGPAGSGKTTLCMRLTESYPQFIHRVITCTTRPPRVGEIDGEDYYFLTRQEFEAQFAAGKFLEKAVVHNNLYGCRKADIAKHLSAGYDALLNATINGESVEGGTANDLSYEVGTNRMVDGLDEEKPENL